MKRSTRGALGWGWGGGVVKALVPSTLNKTIKGNTPAAGALALLMGELRHGADKGLFAQTARPHQTRHHPFTLHHQSSDSHSPGWGLY